MDSRYIDEILNGNTSSFSYFIKTYQNKAFGVAMAIVKQEDDAKDVVQESFITAYSSLSKFRKDSKFSTWFYRIVVNNALQLIKKNKRKVEVIENFSISDTEKTGYNDVLRKLEKEELRRLIESVFKTIPPKEALILQLHYIDELSIKDIDEITDFSKSNIKVLLHRGRTNFYNKLKEKNIKRPYI